jgi:hypothetical protein
MKQFEATTLTTVLIEKDEQIKRSVLKTWVTLTFLSVLNKENSCSYKATPSHINNSNPAVLPANL